MRRAAPVPRSGGDRLSYPGASQGNPSEEEPACSSEDDETDERCEGSPKPGAASSHAAARLMTVALRRPLMPLGFGGFSCRELSGPDQRARRRER